MSEKHTPGPWTWEQHGSPEDGWYTVLHGAWDISHNRAGQPGVVADGRYSALTTEENAANARLIAAAPEMLAILEGCAEMANDWEWNDPAGAFFDSARALLDKINGPPGA